jgi:isoleucyl-tRNA synthetase
LDLLGQRVELTRDDVLVETVSTPGYSCAESEGYLVALDTAVTPELEREGLAREIVRSIQEARKQGGFEIADRVRIFVGGAPALQRALFEHQDFILQETLGEGFLASAQGADFAADREVDGERLSIALKKA